MSLEEKGIGAIETWAIVEVMGHSKYAGFVRSVSIGMGAMIRVDVPEIPERLEERDAYDYSEPPAKLVKKKYRVAGVPAFTKFLGVQSIFALTPCSEEVARKAIETFRSAPVTVLEMPAPRLLRGPRDDDMDNYDDGR